MAVMMFPNVGLNSEGGLAAAQWLGDMFSEGLMVENVDYDTIFTYFAEGELAMFINGPWFSTRLEEEAGGINYSIDPIPGAEGGLENGTPFAGGQGFVISAFSDKQLVAQQFLTEFLATPENMARLGADRLPIFEGVVADDPNFADFAAAGFNAVPDARHSGNERGLGRLW